MRACCEAAILLGMVPGERRLLLELEHDDLLRGTIGPEGEKGRRFVGYTQLIAAIETLAGRENGTARRRHPGDEAMEGSEA